MYVVKYKLIIDMNYQEGSYNGVVVASLKDVKKFEKIIFNSVELDIKQIKINNAPVNYKQDVEKEELIIDNDGSEGELELIIEYNGKASNNLTGFYKAKYSDKFMLSTQFEAIGARRMFPCIDNPSYKAKFQLIVTIEKPYEVISNTLPETVEELESKRRFIFKETPKMSTYLLYVGMGIFDKLEDRLGNILLRAIVPEGRGIEKSRIALDYEKQFLEYYQKYFEIPYPLQKEDVIGVPEFAMGAMENWGAITFREIVFMNDNSTSTQVKRRIAEVMAHELAHQWFGNLVTMKWWNDLWLNESAATFISYKAVDKLFPEWNYMNDFIIMEMRNAFVTDSLINTHPIEVKIENAKAIDQIFDEISYGKGASILRMVDAYIGEENFRKGLTSYLTKYSYGNAEGTDFWKELDQISNQPVSRIISAWIKKAGYPVVYVTYKNKTLILKQQRFLLNKDNVNDLWPIPLTIYINGEVKKILMDKEQIELPLDMEPEIIKANYMQTGFYRVHYDKILFAQIIKGIKELSPYDRFGILNDTYNMVLRGDIELKSYLDVVKILLDDTDFLVVMEILNNMSELISILPDNANILSVSKEFLIKQVDRLGIDKIKGEKEEESMIRGAVMSLLARIDNEFAKKIADKFTIYDSVDNDLKRAVGIAAAVSGDISTFEHMVYKYRNTTGDEDKLRLLSYLFMFKEKHLVTIPYIMMFSGEVKKQDWPSIVANSIVNPSNRDVAWLWTKLYIPEFVQMFKESSIPPRTLQAIIPILGLNRENEIKNYFEENKFEYANTGIKRGFELLRVSSEMLRKYKND